MRRAIFFAAAAALLAPAAFCFAAGDSSWATSRSKSMNVVPGVGEGKGVLYLGADGKPASEESEGEDREGASEGDQAAPKVARTKKISVKSGDEEREIQVTYMEGAEELAKTFKKPRCDAMGLCLIYDLDVRKAGKITPVLTPNPDPDARMKYVIVPKSVNASGQTDLIVVTPGGTEKDPAVLFIEYDAQQNVLRTLTVYKLRFEDE